MNRTKSETATAIENCCNSILHNFDLLRKHKLKIGKAKKNAFYATKTDEVDYKELSAIIAEVRLTTCEENAIIRKHCKVFELNEKYIRKILKS